tara:strand:+ start:878 stop:1177 length:300 start_codon:yes stop_codon:yes gene_type:complete
MESNRIIAEFMGFTQEKNIGWYDNDMLMSQNVYDSQDGNCFNELLFHTSWDWIIPVVEKCLTTDENTEHQHYFINDALLTCNIEVVYDSVVEFIESQNN